MSRRNQPDTAASDGGEMSLTDHLKELRNRVAVCVAFLVVAILVCLYFSPQLVELFTDLGKEYDYQFVYIAPQELLAVQLSIAAIGGLVISAPVLCYHIYAFCAPGLKRTERLFFLLAVGFGTLCFCVGVLFAYKITVPFMLYFFMDLSVGTDISASVSIQSYVNFLLTVFVVFGAVFELPVLSVLLTRLGLLRPQWLARSRKVLFVLIFLLAAVITPPDVISQIMVAVPMMALLELSIFLCRICEKLWRPGEKTTAPENG
ncbi:MAG: twin-arginine translocase subunit TatC [Clostridiales bacterium]|nr:twin-arginine translocase subunit TatC [Clostridiales bacterium]